MSGAAWLCVIAWLVLMGAAALLLFVWEIDVISSDDDEDGGGGD